MKLSKLFTKTTRENPKDEISTNAQLLERGGFVYKNSAGVYTFLPLGWRVVDKIANIIREEMNKIGGVEMLMPALVEKKYLDATKRWDVEIGFEARGKEEKKAGFILGWTHEEVITEIASKFVSSYKDLPFAAYQIQTKFRNEPRVKSGLLRGREFMMKDLYSFHASEENLRKYYEEVKEAYLKIFHRCGLEAIYTVAAGGDFTASNTHEFQVVAAVGEDTIFVCEKCGYAENSEISNLKTGDACPKCLAHRNLGEGGGGEMIEKKTIEVGNIFPLGTKYSKAFNLQFVNESGKKDFVVMGSYGIGLGRVMGAVVEVHHDENGIIWPESVAPFKIHLIALDPALEKGRRLSTAESKQPLFKGGVEGVKKEADEIYEKILHGGGEILYDDRDDKTAGEKFADADLIGCPVRLVISEKTLQEKSVEVKRRGEKEIRLLAIDDVVSDLL